MRRRFYEEVLYDYSSNAEATRHCHQMMEKGWTPFNRDNEEGEAVIYLNGSDTYPWSVWYMRQN